MIIAFSMATAVAMLGLALAVPVNAQANVVNRRVVGAEQGTIYVAAGILGDVQIGPCLNSGAQVVAFPMNSAGASPTPTVSAGVAYGEDLNICSGGEVQTYTPAAGFNAAPVWEVKITDWIYNGIGSGAVTPGLDSATGALELPAVGLARLQATYAWRTNPDGNVQGDDGLADPDMDGNGVCLNGSADDINACLTQFGGTEGAFRNTNVWGVCGWGEVTVSEAQMNPTTNAVLARQVPLVGTYGVTAQVFVDGAVFFQLDCPLAGPAVTNTVSDVYNDLTQEGNNDALLGTGCPVGGAGSFCTEVNSYICSDSNNGVTMGALPDGPCLFPLPTAPSGACMQGSATADGVGLPGIVGTVYQDFNAASQTLCGGPAIHDAAWGGGDSDTGADPPTNIWVFTPVDVGGGIFGLGPV